MICTSCSSSKTVSPSAGELKRWLLHNGWSSALLAQKLEVSCATVENWLHNGPPPHGPNRARIQRVTGIVWMVVKDGELAQDDPDGELAELRTTIAATTEHVAQLTAKLAEAELRRDELGVMVIGGFMSASGAAIPFDRIRGIDGNLRQSAVDLIAELVNKVPSPPPTLAVLSECSGCRAHNATGVNGSRATNGASK